MSVGDIISLPAQRGAFPRSLERLPEVCSASWFAEIAAQQVINGDRSPAILMEALQGHYGHMFQQWKREPGWIKNRRVPSTVIHEIRRQHALGGSSPELVIPHSGHGGVHFCIPSVGLVADAERVCRFDRLREIRQLSTLPTPVAEHVAGGSVGEKPARWRFAHTRAEHSRLVAAVMTLLAHNLGLHPLGQATVAGIGHDTLTAAGGDMTHKLDREAFDEDKHFATFARSPAFGEFARHWGLSVELITETIAGRGLLGDILDFADKLAYVGLDVHMYLQAISKNGPLWYPKGFLEIEGLVREHPDVCRVWETAEIREGQLVVGDFESLVAFLQLRMLLFRWLYYNPMCLPWENAIAELVLRPMYESGFVTHDELLQHDDRWLSRQMDVFLERPARSGGEGFLESLEPHAVGISFETYPTVEIARARARQFNDDLSVSVVVDEMPPMTKTGADRFRVWDQGRVKTFRRAAPKHASALDALLHGDRSVVVGILDLRALEIPERVWPKLNKAHF
ncbi:MAG: hypothetical protein WCO79_03090 [bacterium]